MNAHLQRPRRVGFGDASTFDFTGDFSDLPTTSSGAIDWGAMSFPAPNLDFSLPTSAGSAFDLSKVANQVTKGAQTWFGAQTAINNADYASQLAKARAQAAVAQAKAGGANAAQTARAGLPSPTLLLAAGVALGAVLLLRR